MVRKELEGEVILWLKGRLTREALGEGVAPRVSAMREAGGESHRHADAASVAFQLEFPGIVGAKKWARDSFSKIADEFTARFGQESLVFTSIFEIF